MLLTLAGVRLTKSPVCTLWSRVTVTRCMQVHSLATVLKIYFTCTESPGRGAYSTYSPTSLRPVNQFVPT